MEGKVDIKCRGVLMHDLKECARNGWSSKVKLEVKIKQAIGGFKVEIVEPIYF